jgi:hypothetical protein
MSRIDDGLDVTITSREGVTWRLHIAIASVSVHRDGPQKCDPELAIDKWSNTFDYENVHDALDDLIAETVIGFEERQADK